DRHVARMVARGCFLFEGGLVLFIDDDQSQPPSRGEDRGTNSDYHLNLARGDALPVLVPLGVGQVAVEDGHAGEPLAKPLDRLRCQADLWDEHDRFAAEGHNPFDRREVNLSLTAAGHAVDQKWRETA